jgi:hypothetical protein
VAERKKRHTFLMYKPRCGASLANVEGLEISLPKQLDIEYLALSWIQR